MSVRRNIGDIVRKQVNTGFYTESLVVQIASSEGNYECQQGSIYMEPCFICEDEKCMVWPDLQVMENGPNPICLPTGKMCYHISECQMEDI